MARRKNKSPIDDLFDFLPGATLILLALIWLSTGDVSLVITIFIVIVILIFSTGFILWRRRTKSLLASGIEKIDAMSGQMFEQLLLEHFKKLGYRGKTTAETADYGADLILERDNLKYVVQAKRWKQNVGIEAIQQIIGAISYYGVDQGMVITNSYFTKNAKKLAQANKIELWDRKKLINMLNQAKGRSLDEGISGAGNFSATDYNAEYKCPRCGNKLILRSGGSGQFYGCKSFPKCRYTQNFC